MPLANGATHVVNVEKAPKSEASKDSTTTSLEVPAADLAKIRNTWDMQAVTKPSTETPVSPPATDTSPQANTESSVKKPISPG